MEYNLKTAVEQMKNHEESGMNYIYSKTYNYVYLRAKSILRRESDVQQLLREVYLKMLDSATEIEVDNLYEWIGKCAYTMGCGYYRKKKARERGNGKPFSSVILKSTAVKTVKSCWALYNGLFSGCCCLSSSCLPWGALRTPWKARSGGILSSLLPWKRC